MYSIPKILFDEVIISFISSHFKYSINAFSRAFAKVSPLDRWFFIKALNSKFSLTKTLEIFISLFILPDSEPKNKLLTTPRLLRIETEPFAKNSADETA